MQVTVQLAPELQAQLAAEAQARGLALDLYIVDKLEQLYRPVRDKKAVSEAVDAIRALRKGNTLGGIPIAEFINEGRKY